MQSDDTCRNFVKVIFPIRPLRYYVIVILSQSQWLNMHEVNNDLMILLMQISTQTYSPDRNRNKTKNPSQETQQNLIA